METDKFLKQNADMPLGYKNVISAPHQLAFENAVSNRKHANNWGSKHTKWNKLV